MDVAVASFLLKRGFSTSGQRYATWTLTVCCSSRFSAQEEVTNQTQDSAKSEPTTHEELTLYRNINLIAHVLLRRIIQRLAQGSAFRCSQSDTSHELVAWLLGDSHPDLCAVNNHMAVAQTPGVPK